MPAKRRREIMDPTRVGAYHCYSRCVRRAFLAGIDLETGRDFSQRKDWVRKRLEDLASVFAIDVLDHAVMENHVHTILRNRPELARAWTKREVAERWLRLSRKRLALLDPPDRDQVEELLKTKGRVDVLRKRLANISWFMIMLNEPLALRANLEDEVSGHFWAERFGSMRLENDESLLLCSLYVDLNPIRAGAATSPETSTYTGACDRLRDLQQELLARRRRKGETLRRVLGEQPDELELDARRVLRRKKPRSGWMSPVRVEGDGYEGAAAGRRASDKGYLPMTLEKYLQLLDACGREQSAGKRGVIPAELPPLLERLGWDKATWSDEAAAAARRFARIGAQCARQTAERKKREKKEN